MEPIVEALKRLVIAVKGEGTVDDVNGTTITEVIDELTEAYTNKEGE